jgi:tRNA pseudouridine38-40 synthase
MQKYKLTIAYDGTEYSGWQIQPNAKSIQQTLQETLKIFLQHDVVVIGSGRTDAGVHALAQVAHFQSPCVIEPAQFLAAANSLLPVDIRILDIERAPDNFHAQHSATGKIYHYNFSKEAVRDPFSRLYRVQIPHTIDLQELQQTASMFLGTHDFCAFANVSPEGTASYDSIRTISRIDLIEEKGGLRLEFEGDGFLYKMVRNIVGTLFEVAAGKRQRIEIAEILHSKDRRKAGKAAPAHGLFLVKVFYD